MTGDWPPDPPTAAEFLQSRDHYRTLVNARCSRCFRLAAFLITPAAVEDAVDDQLDRAGWSRPASSNRRDLCACNRPLPLPHDLRSLVEKALRAGAPTTYRL